MRESLLTNPSTDNITELELSAIGGETAVDLLAGNCALSRADLKRAMQAGSVWLARGTTTRRVRRAKTKLVAGDLLRLHLNATLASEAPLPAKLIADEGEYSAWFKPGGMFTQGTKWGDANSIERVAELALEQSIRIVHRLDRHTSGIILLAHNKRAAAALSQLFIDRSIQKTYQAIVHGTAVEQIVDAPLDDKLARSRVSVLQSGDTISLLQVIIETGRKHQVRRHLASIGTPIVGDRLHGKEPDESRAALQLCAAELQFICPLTGEPRHYLSPELLSMESLNDC